MLVRVVAPHFVAGLVFELSLRGHLFCVDAAPILRWCLGCDADYLRGQFRRKKWQAWVISEVSDAGLQSGERP